MNFIARCVNNQELDINTVIGKQLDFDKRCNEFEVLLDVTYHSEDQITRQMVDKFTKEIISIMEDPLSSPECLSDPVWSQISEIVTRHGSPKAFFSSLEKIKDKKWF